MNMYKFSYTAPKDGSKVTVCLIIDNRKLLFTGIYRKESNTIYNEAWDALFEVKNGDMWRYAE